MKRRVIPVKKKVVKKKKIPITQIRVSPAIKTFAPVIRKKFGLQPYNNLMKPAFFFGCYKDHDLVRILLHRSVAVVIWGGTDANYKARPFAKKAFRALRKRPRTYHVAISDYISKDLSAWKIPSKRICLSFTDQTLFNPHIKKDGIYIYISALSPEKYGGALLNQIIPELTKKYQIILTTNKGQITKIKKKDLNQYPFLKYARYAPYFLIQRLYSQCFIGLRLTKHDGNANTVQELGLCGLKCVYNGDPKQPNTIPWQSKEDILKAVEEEAKQIGQKDTEMAEKMKQYLATGKKWLNLSYY